MSKLLKPALRSLTLNRLVQAYSKHTTCKQQMLLGILDAGVSEIKFTKI